MSRKMYNGMQQYNKKALQSEGPRLLAKNL
jgi:hypothetical protein